jgi:hypothetical protein
VRISNPLLPADALVIEGAGGEVTRLGLPAVRIVAVALGALLLGYMFLGRGFAHLGFPPLYVGEIVLAICIAATGFAIWRDRVRAAPSRIVWLLLALMVLGAARTIPYLGTYGLDSLRDATLWGYAAFALMIYVIADRDLVVRAFRLYGWVVMVFAVWLPISYNVFAALSRDIDPSSPGSFVPLVFFKGGDMAVHIVGVTAFLVLGASTALTRSSKVLRALIGVPLLLTAFIAGAANRGALVTAMVGIALIVALAPRSRNWLPLLAATAVFAIGVTAQGVLVGPAGSTATPTATSYPTASLAPTSTVLSQPGASATDRSVVPPPKGPGSTTVPQPGDHLMVANSSFELGPLNDGTIHGWFPRLGATLAPDGTASYNIVDGAAHEGTRFASVRNVLNAYQATIASTHFPFADENDIAVSVWVKAIAARPVLEVYVNWYDSAGSLISSDFVSSVATHGAGTWQESAGAVAAPPNTTQAQILLYEATGSGATIGIDDVTVQAGDFVAKGPGSTTVPQPGDHLMVANSSFELGPLNDGTIHGWFPRLGATLAPDGTASYNIVDGAAHEGTRFASVRNVLNAYQATIASTHFPFADENDIAVSVWVKAIAARPVLEVYVNWYDSAGSLISSDFVSSVATHGAGTWQESAGAVAAPPNTTQAQILLYEATGSGATIGIDDVTVQAGDFVPEPPVVPPPPGRPATIGQLIENILSVFGSSSNQNLEGTKEFRLAWWGKIVNYTVFGDYFWAGKGFGVNLADSDGFQTTSDHSLRAPHNSNFTVLARLGVPGFALWVLILSTFGIGLLRAVWSHRRAGDLNLAAVAGWLLAYWVAMMVDTSFDPYIEGPQGGIWFWTVIGLGLVVIRLRPNRSTA